MQPYDPRHFRFVRSLNDTPAIENYRSSGCLPVLILAAIALMSIAVAVAVVAWLV